MTTYHILFNNSAGGHEDGKNNCVAMVEKLGKVNLVDVEKLSSHKEFLASISPEDVVVICGGDGTLNHYVNGLRGVEYPNKVMYYPGGSGNDFYHCVSTKQESDLVEVTEYLKNLPTAYIKGKEYAFLNGIGYGIDGYCCEAGDELRAKNKKVDYTMIAIVGVLYKYKPTGVTVVVDGVEHRFEKAWLAPVMNGRYYGGGMIPTPDQKRNSGELSVLIAHDLSRLRILTVFSSLFKGEHVKYEKYFTVLKGKEITVKYDVPKPLQVDGETILDVSECTVKAFGI